jgi:hypothetical protein
MEWLLNTKPFSYRTSPHDPNIESQKTGLPYTGNISVQLLNGLLPSYFRSVLEWSDSLVHYIDEIFFLNCLDHCIHSKTGPEVEWKKTFPPFTKQDHFTLGHKSTIQKPDYVVQFSDSDYTATI